MAIPVEYIVQRYFGYAPSHVGAVVGLVIFATLAAASTALTLYTRAHRFMLVVALTAAFEAGGYVCRLIVMSKPSLAPFAAMQVLCVLFCLPRPPPRCATHAPSQNNTHTHTHTSSWGACSPCRRAPTRRSAASSRATSPASSASGFVCVLLRDVCLFVEHRVPHC